MNDDASLLREFAQTGAESAFAELVRRHLDLVHSAALRQVAGDAHRAEDVTQAVFVELARQARRLAEHRSLAGWLYTTARHVAARNQRTEQRRLAREQSAHAMNEVPGSPPPDWADLRPLLDEAMHRLSTADREAVVLRVFQNHSLAVVGGALGISENAARMRVDRALDRLRHELARRGVVSTAAALASVLGAHAVTPAPAGLALAVAAAAKGVPLAATGLMLGSLGEAAALFMTTKKWLAVGAVVLASVAVVAPRLARSPAPPEVEVEFNPLVPVIISTNVNLAAGFKWAAIEAADYRQFIANLRASGAPERLVRDVVALELSRNYVPRYREVLGPQPETAYWQKTKHRPVTFEQQRRYAELDAEVRAILRGLFGPDMHVNDAINLLHCQPDLDLMALAWLPDDMVPRIRATLEPILARQRAEQKPQETGLDEERRLQQQLEALRPVLTAGQLEEYRLRNSPAIQNIKSLLRHWDVSEAEFREMVRHNDNSLFNPTTRMEDLRARETAATKLFGAERAASFVRATDLGYGYAKTFVAQTGLPPETADQYWEVKRATLAADERLRQNPQLSPAQRQHERSALAARAKAEVTALVGAGGLRSLRQDWPWWRALENPEPGTP